MPSHPPVPFPRGRAVRPVLIAAVCAALGLVAALLLNPFGDGPATAATAVGPRGDARIYSRLEPSVVDVTATLRYAGETASGTGFVVDARDGLILTNNHVIKGATAVTVRLTSTGRIYPARIVGADMAADIAVLQLRGVTGLTAAPLGGPAAVPVGTSVLAIGNRGGKDGSPAAAPGVIDGENRTIRAKDGVSDFTETLHGMLQTSARIEPGDSGGPLAGPAGRVIGVDTAAGAGTSRAGFAIPIGAAMAVERRIAAGRPGAGITLGTGGFLGVVITSTTSPSPASQARQERAGAQQAHKKQSLTGTGGPVPPGACLGSATGAPAPAAVAPARSGALVDGVLCGTGAATAGIAPGDVITAAAGRRVSSPDGLAAILRARRPGTAVPVTWIDVAGARRTSRISLAVAPAA